MSRCARSPSLVSRISPVVSASRRPTGYRRSRLGTSDDDRRAPLRVARRGDVARRLVDARRRRGGARATTRLPVDRRPRRPRHVAGGVAHDLAVDRHAAGERRSARRRAARRRRRGRGTWRGASRLPPYERPMDLDAARPDARRRRRAGLPRAAGVALGGRRRAGLRGDDRPPGRAARGSSPRACRSRRSRSCDEAHASDGTVKALFHTHDGRPVEAVLMRYRDGRRSVCVSSQSGCPLTCTFCATGSMRFGRNLTASEILDQVLHFRRIEPVDHLVFMGMGEPMMNLDAVLGAAAPAARRRHHPPPHRRLHRRLGAGHRAADGERDADAARALAARARGRAALAASCRSTTAIRSPRCSRPARPTTRAAAGGSSSST